MKSSRPFPGVAVLFLFLAASAASAAGGGQSPRFLTGPQKGSAREIALAYLGQQGRSLGVTERDLPSLVVIREYTSPHNGVTHVFLRQHLGGLEVAGADVAVHVARDGSIINVGGGVVSNLAEPAGGRRPTLDAAQALESAARHLGLTVAGPVPAKLVYQPVGKGAVRLAWQLEIEEPGGEHWWNVKVDAATGAVLDKFDQVVQDDFGKLEAPAAKAPGREARALSLSPKPVRSSSAPDTYNVFALPKESPYDGDRTLVADPANALASPFRWHDTNGVDGAEFTITRGNNVHAYTDLNADNIADPDSSPDGGAGLLFDFPLDLTLDPSTYRPAAVTNLFYWNNLMHDVFYQYGFTEAAGNFQVNTYGRGGLGNDDVRAEAQDGSGTNNANFGTPVDGFRPRMQMFIWTGGLPFAVTVNSGPIAGDYLATGAVFGPQLDTTGPLSGTAVVAADGTEPTGDACQPLVGFPAGSIAIVDRGTCTFVLKVANAQAAGAIGVIVANNVPGNPVTMGGADATITIPSLMVRQEHGVLLKANVPLDATLRVNPNRPPNRDSDIDAGVIAHEYGHGISNRLTGGPAVVNCLNNQEQMGEGWSDYIALVMTAKAGDTATQARGIGNYVSFRPPDGGGIRPAPYTTDMTVNPVTYGAIPGLAVPHGVGYAWASMLWEVYWNLVGKHGFNPDIYGHWTTGGNNLAVQLMVDGLKLQVCRPGFVDGRDAILLADQALTGGANQCLIWRGFAKRGLGFSASQGLSTSSTDGVEAFDLPALCQAGITVAPASLASTQVVNSSTSQALTVTNTSAADGTALEWTITEASDSCATPVDLPWVSASPDSGTTEGAAHSTVNVTFDSHGLAVGTYSGRLCISSNASSTPVVEVPLSLTVIYDFRGFFFPVDNPPAVNVLNAGVPVLLRFSLGGNFGTDVLAADSPSWQQIDCATGAPIGASEAADSLFGLRFIPGISQYLDIIRTRLQWRGTCRRLTLSLNDGTSHPALFRFR
jgi:extracellular elastinolytic metalloproteinase